MRLPILCLAACLAGMGLASPAIGSDAAGAALSASGSISNLDLNNGKVSLRVSGAKTGGYLILELDALTKVTRDGRAATLGDLRTGDAVKVSYSAVSAVDNVAASIDATAAKAPAGKGRRRK